MKLIGPAGWLLVGAAIGYTGFVWKGAESRWPFFAGGNALLAAGIASGKLPIFLLLVIATTAAFLFEATRGRAKPWVAGGLALSDLSLAGAIVIYQLQSTQWDLPSPGQWGDATPLIAAAAALRFAGSVSDDALDTTGAAVIGWWQGALLAWWVGSSAILVGLGLALPIICLFARRKQSVFVIAGSLACVIAGTSGDPLLLLAAGTAATAFVLGERVVSVWALAALPLSLLAVVRLDEIRDWGAAASAAGIVGMAIVASALSTPGAWGGRVVAAVAITAALISTGVAVQWWLYGLAASAGLAILTTRPEDVSLARIPAERLVALTELPRGRWEVLVFAAWVMLGVNSLATLGLLVLGGRTGFL